MSTLIVQGPLILHSPQSANWDVEIPSLFLSHWSRSSAFADFFHELTVGPPEMQGILLSGVGEMAHFHSAKYALKPCPKATIPIAIQAQIKIVAGVEADSSWLSLNTKSTLFVLWILQQQPLLYFPLIGTSSK